MLAVLGMGLGAICQDDATDRRGLLMNVCSFEPTAEVMVLSDKGDISVNNDYSIRLDRQLTIKFFHDHKVDKGLSELVFYQCSSLARYTRLSISTVDIDQTTKAAVTREVTRPATLHLEQAPIRIRRGMLLKVSYSINIPYEEKLPAWRFQSQYPTEHSEFRMSTPEAVHLQATLVGGYTPDINESRETARQTHLNGEMQPTKVRESEYQFNQLPSWQGESFSLYSPENLEHLSIYIASISTAGEVKKDLANKQVNKIVEDLSVRPDYLPRLSAELPIKSDFDKRIRSLTDDQEKLARIYDLVRRHITWDGRDSLSARPLAKVWLDKKGNSTEINLALVRLLIEYGYDAAPLLVSTPEHGRVDTLATSLTDFDRTVAHVFIGDSSVVLDATAKYYDYPMLPGTLLNTWGLLISMDPHRWVYIQDKRTQYYNNVILLGHLTGDSSYLTNVYVNSTGYAKAEHVTIYEHDSLKGIRNYFERGNKALRMKHFIVANEWVDTLPLAQEFDIRMPPIKNDNLYGIIPTAFAVPDTLFTITADRKSPVNFGYRQQYDLVSEFSYPERYEIYLLPNNVQLSAVNGNVHFEREFHNNTTNFSLKQSLVIDKTYFTVSEALELSKFLRKVENLQKQQVVLKRLY
ncbi:MAG: hypothetical protein JSS76_07515 [Bacteroidetes bacterium]|nr:hypothetical protein [Bacteroidota bacterium]